MEIILLSIIAGILISNLAFDALYHSYSKDPIELVIIVPAVLIVIIISATIIYSIAIGIYNIAGYFGFYF